MKYVKRDVSEPGFIVWAGISVCRKTNLGFMKQNVLVQSKFDIETVLKAFFKKSVPRVFPGSCHKNMVFHQHSASLC